MKKLTTKPSIIALILALAFLPQFISYAAKFFQQVETGWVVWETSTPVQRLAWDGSTLWAGHYKGGLSQWNLETGQLAGYTTTNGLSGNHVVSIAVDGGGQKWLALQDGSLNLTMDGASFSDLTPAGIAGSDLLREIGFDEGSTIVGWIIGRVPRLTDKTTIKLLDGIFDDLVEQGIKLSDEAAEGLGRATKMFSGYELEGFISKLRIDNPDKLDSILHSIKKLDEGGLLDAGKNLKGKVGIENFANLVSKYGTDPNDLADAEKVLSVLGDSTVSKEAVEIAMNQSPEAARALAGWGDVLKNNDPIARKLAQRATKDAATLKLVKNWTTDNMPSLDDLIAIGKNSRDGVGSFWGLGALGDYDSGFVKFARDNNGQFYFTHPEVGAKVNAIFPGDAFKPQRDAIFWPINEEALAGAGGPIASGMPFKYSMDGLNTADVAKERAAITDLRAGESLEYIAATYFNNKIPFRMREVELLLRRGYDLTGDTAQILYWTK